MNRDFLESLGLSKDQIDSVMAKHGSTVNSLQDDIRTLEKSKEQLEEQNKQHSDQLEELKGSEKDDDLKARIQELQDENEQLKEQHDTDLSEQQRQSKIEIAVAKLGTKDDEYIKAKLNDLELKDGELNGFDDRINELKEAHPLLFESSEPAKPAKWSQGGISTNTTGTLTREQIMQEPDRATRQQLIRENKDLF